MAATSRSLCEGAQKMRLVGFGRQNGLLLDPAQSSVHCIRIKKMGGCMGKSSKTTRNPVSRDQAAPAGYEMAAN